MSGLTKCKGCFCQLPSVGDLRPLREVLLLRVRMPCSPDKVRCDMKRTETNVHVGYYSIYIRVSFVVRMNICSTAFFLSS